MKEHIVLILIFWINSTFSQTEPVLEYLGGVHRLNESSYIDYYFSCKSTGTTIHWQVNGNLVALDVTDIGKARLCPHSEVQCIATLLSSKPQNGQLQFVSILLVSTNFSVPAVAISCSTDSNTSDTINTATSNLDNPIINKMAANVFLQYVFQAQILDNMTTYFYICGANNTMIQGWITPNLNSGYSPTDTRGKNLTFISEGHPIAVEAAILIGFQPYSIVSILMVSGEPRNISCIDPEVQLAINNVDILPTPPPTPPPTVTTNTVTESSSITPNTPSFTGISTEYGTSNPTTSIGTEIVKPIPDYSIALIITFGALIVLLMVGVITFAIVSISLCRRIKKKPPNTNSGKNHAGYVEEKDTDSTKIGNSRKSSKESCSNEPVLKEYKRDRVFSADFKDNQLNTDTKDENRKISLDLPVIPKSSPIFVHPRRTSAPNLSTDSKSLLK